jgi:peptidoglycan/xylan/chitin deacetylase (PgdA/CDA1 family)
MRDRHSSQAPALGTAVLLLLTMFTIAGPVVPATGPQPSASGPRRQIAITVDDLPVVSAIDHSQAHFERVTADLVRTIVRHRIPAVGFVNEGKLWANGAADPARIALLEQWVAAGLELGNHTFSHLDFHAASVEDMKHEVARGDEVTRRLMARQNRVPRYFRHPYLHTGLDAGARSSLERFLAERGYAVAPVTVDNSDYVFARAYDRAVADADPHAIRKIADAYVENMQGVMEYYERQSSALFGREIPQVLLVHANALNADVFDRVAAMLEERGYVFVALDRALNDAAYRSEDTYFGAGGISWLHRWALSQGKPRESLAGEPDVPTWIQQAAAGGTAAVSP